MQNLHHYDLVSDDGQERLDRLLARLLPELSRSRIVQLIKAGRVLQGDIPLTEVAAFLPEGTPVRVLVPEAEPVHLVAQNIPLDILYEDAALLVLNKPAGMAVHPAPGHPDGTLVNALLHHCQGQLSGIGGAARPGIVHRLDKDTTGLMVVAKTDAAHQHLSAQLAERTLKRHYLALVWGVPNPPEGEIDAPIARHPQRRQEMAVVPGGRAALTRYRVLQSFGGTAALVECALKTGRTHQIRVHLTHKKHPLVGDATYNATAPKHPPEALIEGIAALGRQALHAYRLTLIHPELGKALRCEAPLPADFQRVLTDFSSP